jgi:hypothetical protein
MSAANAFTVHKAAIEALVDRIHALSAPLILDDAATWRHVNAMAAAHEKLCDALLVMRGIQAPPVSGVVR